MATRKENMNGVQQELLRIIQSDEARELIESMANRMAVIEEAYYRIRELREAVQPYIPEHSEHDEKYWLAAYLVRPHAATVTEKLKQLREIQHKLAQLEAQLQELNRQEAYLENKLGDLDTTQENVADNVYKLIGEDANSYLSLGDTNLYDLLYETIRGWAAQQLSANRS
jgi:small-conductance mechanosensitive channel